ncbi:PaaX family transcriptional regulator C-terminal domain-containing protein [Streptomyces ipomoeae]|jgi:phenylacetic acid degradation operon negative regulatory protein|nr:PaaX family transcriptional regulator C-terminal domain-containing protein [Streptomyces ipomoeae]MDX2692595.1 PaaX family transcriptional regulator C-terminal domain-containing protein [Streptomyces ipomoeae]MDX2819543.1 PaaX family transcriptional regulator C-terminal domain-containing protein [Streptomyces ipomoeae]MDX2840815.1 PaaX family transcriptional regulator C-terminal domain-containing protein [Streptomyces ipomoeae]MDX2873328.1 PaaX family transcriptional regulator C-terminal dom
MQMKAPRRPAELQLRPLSARSVVLSLLLGTHPPELPVKELVRRVEPFGVAGSTVRAALSRMVSAGDLRRTDTVYRLSDRLLERQRRQDEAVHPETLPWNGDWEMVVVTGTGREAAERAELRARLTALRLAELREGVWLRPVNLRRDRPPALGPTVQHFTTRPGRPADELAASLWPLDTWAATAEALLAHIEHTRRPADRFTALAAAVRHLLADPVLPTELLPADWPGPGLRAMYADYRRELAEEGPGHAD